MADDVLVKVGADISSYSKEMSKASKELGSFTERNSKTFDAFKKTGAAVTGAGVALSAGLGYAVKTAADFESGMSEVAAISGATADEFDALEKRARELGGSTSFSAKEASEGLSFLALAGWDTKQMIDGLEPVLHLAEAGALDLGRSADLVTDSMAGLGVGVDELDGYLDKVAQTSRESNTDIDVLMEAFVIAGGTFDRLNIPLEESNAFLGVLANRGFKASQAGTAINAIMTRLTQSSGPAADALEEMGVSAFDSEGNFRGMETVLTDIEKSMETMADAEKAHYQQQLAGLNHGKTFSAMLSGLGDEYKDLKGEIIDSDGALLEMRDTMKDNLQGAMENLNSAFEEILISLGSALLPAVKEMSKWLQKLADWFNNLDDSTKGTIAIVGGITAALLLIIGPILLLIGFIPSIIAGFTAIGTVLAAIFNPVTLIIGGIIALGAALIYAYNEIERFRYLVDEAWAWISDTFNAALDFIMGIVKEIFGAVREFIGEQLAKIMDFWDEYGEMILGIVETVFKNIWEQIKMYINLVKGIFEAVWPIISNVVKLAWDFIKMYVEIGIDLVLGIVRTVMNLLKGDWSGAWEEIKKTASNILDSIVNTFKNIDLLQIGKDIINGLIKGITSMVGSIKESVSNMASNLPGWIKKPLGIKSPSRIFMQLGDSIGEGLAIGIEDTTKLVGRATDKLVDIAKPEVGDIDMSYATPDGIHSTLTSAVSGTVDVNSRDDMIARAIDHLGNKLENLRIEMDRREMGRLVNDEITDGRNDNIRGGGRRRL